MLPGFAMTLQSLSVMHTQRERERFEPYTLFSERHEPELEGCFDDSMLPGKVIWVARLTRADCLSSFVVRCHGYLAGCRAKKTKNVPSE